jgi:hypothetical protein
MSLYKLSLKVLFASLALFAASSHADRIYSEPAYCLKYGQYTLARTITWHSPLLQYPNTYSDKGAKMKIRGLYPK